MTNADKELAHLRITTIDEMNRCLSRLKERLAYLDGSVVLYLERATHIASFSMDKAKQQEAYFVRPDGQEKRGVSSKAVFDNQLHTVRNCTLLTQQDRIHPDLITRKSKQQTFKFADDVAHWEAEKKRQSELTLGHTVPILRFDLQWSPEGERSRFAAALFTDPQKQVHFELANR